MIEVGEGDVEWKDYKFQIKGAPAKSVTMKEVAFAAYTNPGQNEPGLEATFYYDPPNMTFPHGTYIAVVDVEMRFHRTGRALETSRRNHAAEAETRFAIANLRAGFAAQDFVRGVEVGDIAL